MALFLKVIHLDLDIFISIEIILENNKHATGTIIKTHFE